MSLQRTIGRSKARLGWQDAAWNIIALSAAKFLKAKAAKKAKREARARK
jgi:hypothetical protein